jgi:ElaB/YqjD/DUF883 family membrane-anchored ribosome-binding protein
MENTTTVRPETRELRDKMNMLKQDFADVAKTAGDRAVKGTSDLVKDHPLAAIGIVAGVGAGIGLAIGLLVGRNRG